MKNLAIYTCAGYPQKNSLLDILPALSANKVRYIEVGIPYSDPLADGPKLQAVHQKALANGIKIKDIFGQLESLNLESKVLIMCYFNSFLQYGAEAFLQACKQAKVESLIIPDLPFDYYQEHYESLFNSYGIGMVFLIAPTSSEEDIKKYSSASSPFIYALSASSTTGSKQLQLSNSYGASQLKSLSTPVYLGFNIKSKEDVQMALNKADGAIIGTAFAEAIAQAKDVKQATNSFIQSLQA